MLYEIIMTYDRLRADGTHRKECVSNVFEAEYLDHALRQFRSWAMNAGYPEDREKALSIRPTRSVSAPVREESAMQALTIRVEAIERALCKPENILADGISRGRLIFETEPNK